MSGKLVILSGPSGVGKDTIIEAWQRLDPKVERVVTVTTRKPRPGEEDGIDYHFVDDTTFQRMVEANEFLEHKIVHEHAYGTPVSSVLRLLKEGKTAVLKIDVQGAEEVMGVRPDAITVFVLPPSNAVLEERIRSRGTEDEATIQKRLHNALAETGQAKHYQHQLVNDEVERVARQLDALVRGTS